MSKAAKNFTGVYSKDTVIAGTTTWGDIKEAAMKPGYLESPFAMYLQPNEKEILKKCIAA